MEFLTAVNEEFSNSFVRSLSSNIPGWSTQWIHIFEKHQHFSSFVVEAFKTANESRLSQTFSLVGAHKYRESLETAILGDFLIKYHQLDLRGAAVFSRQTSFLPGFVRYALQDPELARQEMAFIIELGDIGR